MSVSAPGFGIRDSGFVFVVMLVALGCGRTGPGQGGPPLPFDEDGACPFQCCTYREWSVEYPTDIHMDRRDDSPAAFHVDIGDTVTATTGVVETTKVGRASASRDVRAGANRLAVPAGQPIYLIRNVGGGDWKIWVNGVVDRQYIPSQGYCTPEKQSSDECAMKVVDQPVNVWWARVQNARGQAGWTREVDHFGNIDACE